MEVIMAGIHSGWFMHGPPELKIKKSERVLLLYIFNPNLYLYPVITCQQKHEEKKPPVFQLQKGKPR